jgi:hypothetical protein
MGFPPPKTGKQFFSSKVVVTIRLFTLESVGNKLKILKKRLMLQANGIYAKILLKFNFTCQDDIFMFQKYFYKLC